MLWSVWLLTDPAWAGLAAYDTTLLDRVRSLVGIVLLTVLCWALSENRKVIPWRTVGWGIGLQVAFCALVLWLPTVSGVFFAAAEGAVNKLLSFSGDGATFVFQSIEPHMVKTGDVPTLLAGGGQEQLFVGRISPPVKTFAFWILPTIIFLSSLMAVLYYYGIMQVVVRSIAKLMMVTFGTSGAESLSTAANIFVGQTEAPLVVRPYIASMTRSELMCIMVGGFATTAAGVMGAYVSFLQGVPNIAGHLMTASFIAAPATFVCAKLMVPETGDPVTRGEVREEAVIQARNVVEAAGKGARDGLDLALNVAAMLIAIVALVAMFDWMLSFAPVAFCDGGGVDFGYQCSAAGAVVPSQPLSLTLILSWVFAPIAVLMGVPWDEALMIGRLLGEKTVLTEFIAYIHLGDLVHSETPQISERGAIIASYALCGFANFASIGIQIGGIGGMAPNRTGDLAALGLKAMVAGTIANCMTGAVVGLMI